MAASPTPAPAQPNRPGPIGIVLAVALILIFLAIAALFAVVTIDVLDVETCEDAARNADSIFVECFDGSEGRRIANIVLGALTTLSALITVGTAIMWASARAGTRGLVFSVISTLILVILTFLV